MTGVRQRLAAQAEAAVILRRIAEALPLPAPVAAYLRGQADGLEAALRTRKRPRTPK
jgi:hypothetical protein